MTTKLRVPAPVLPRQTVVQQGSQTLLFDGTLPLLFTPAQDGSITLSQGNTHNTLPTSAQMTVAQKGVWPSNPPPPPPPVFGPPVDPTHVPLMTKPAKGAPFTYPLYNTQAARVTDHTTDIPGSEFFRNDYSRRQPFNADNTLMFGYIGGGPFAVYRVAGDSWTYLKTLSGPGPDSEIQWDPADPDKLWYIDNNGGTKLYKLSVASNSVVDTIDMGPQVRALWPDAVRYWTKSEGSPSRNNRYWGLMAETSNFDPRGYFVLDTVTRQVIWSMPNSNRPDHVSMSPCGRWFIRSGGEGGGTYAHGVAADVLGQTKQVHHTSEHSDSGILANGHSFYISTDYQTNDGDVFWIDLEDAAATRHVIDTAYHNPAAPGQYSMHLSAKAYAKPGWVVEGRYGDDSHACNIVLLDLNTGSKYGVALNFPVVDSYWDEPHGCPDRTLSRIVVNANFGDSENDDVVLVRLA